MTAVDHQRFLPGSRSLLVGRIALLAVLLLAYLVVVVGYAMSALGAGIFQAATPAANGVALQFVPTALDPVVGAMRGVMYVLPGEDLVDDVGRLRTDLAVDLFPVLGNGSATYEAGHVPTPMTVDIVVTGNVRDYPFDAYTASILSSVTRRDSPTSPWTAVPVAVGAQGELSGWALTFDRPSSVDVGGDPYTTADGYGIQELGARRSVSTIAVALLVLALMVVLALLAAFVARSVALRYRKVEPSLAGWMGAVLFALVPLRNFLPGAPPLGSWIDVLVFFWVEIVLMAAMAIYIGTWLRDGAPSDHADDGRT